MPSHRDRDVAIALQVDEVVVSYNDALPTGRWQQLWMDVHPPCKIRCTQETGLLSVALGGYLATLRLQRQRRMLADFTCLTSEPTYVPATGSGPG